ncbi:hypothetical protein [Salmonella enterica]|uniref:hypothetical protein n=1 Tax=Salmonella enterica TaxID=28901 RepID=UPI003AFA3AA5
MLIIEGKGFIVIIDLRNHRVGENFANYPHFAAQTGPYLAINITNPTALPLLLVFPIFGIANTRFSFDVIEPCVFHPFTSGPDVFTGDGAGVTANTFIEIQYHPNL